MHKDLIQPPTVNLRSYIPNHMTFNLSAACKSCMEERLYLS